MKRMTFQANEGVLLLMPWSEAMLHCRKADRVVYLRVVPYAAAGGRVGHRVDWACEPGQWFSSGYTLSECGIRVEGEGYTGWQRTAEDALPTNEEVQQQAAAITERIATALGGA